jgi:protein tyrosine phosphatase
VERSTLNGQVVPADDYVNDTLNEMLSLHLRHVDIAEHLGVDRFWLRRWVDRELVDERDLDELMYVLSALYPERGERMMLGFVRARNIKLTREQVSA